MSDGFGLESESEGLSQAVTVSELNHHLKAVVEGTFPMMWVAGEVSDVARPRSGHIYFTLKDDDSQIRAVMWRNVAQRLRFDLENGQSVLCFGGLEVYTVRGSYQIVVRKAQPQGVGALQLAFEKLKQRLALEGLFAAERKQALPAHPRRVGLITSPSGAAVHDFLVAAADNRMVGAEIFVIPAKVQGAGSAETIARGLQAAAMIRPKLDVVVVARGGGSLEDLWCFNEEPVVRAISECPVPTVSAVGHEVDVTLADLAADVRALTPTDAAIKVFPDRTGIVARVEQWEDRLHRSIRHQLERRKLALESIQTHPALAKPLELVHLRSRRVDELEYRVHQAIDRHIQQSKSKLATLAASLSALSPLQTLARGYSVTLDENGIAVHDANDVEPGQRVRTKLASGQFTSTIDTIDLD